MSYQDRADWGRVSEAARALLKSERTPSGRLQDEAIAEYFKIVREVADAQEVERIESDQENKGNKENEQKE